MKRLVLLSLLVAAALAPSALAGTAQGGGRGTVDGATPFSDFGWIANSPSPVIVTRSPFEACEVFGTSMWSWYDCDPLAATAEAGPSTSNARATASPGASARRMIPPLS